MAPARPKSDSRYLLEVQAAIHILTEPPNPAAALIRAESLFTILTFLRWPRDPKRAALVCNLLYARYVSDDYYSSAVDTKYKKLDHFLERANPSNIIRTFADTEIDLWILDFYENESQDLVANIVRFFLTSFPIDSFRPSLKKVNYLLFLEHFYDQARVAWSTLSKDWLLYKDAAVFLFVKAYGRHNWIEPNVASENFTVEVDAFLADHNNLSRFFQHAAWASGKFRSALDRRAAADIHWFEFGSELTPLEIALASPDTQTVEHLRTYRSSRY